jgi:tRNA(Arg) A34 adenosine deaminase TadA
MNQSFLEQAIALAVENVRRNGGPFGALIVRDGVVIASGANQVTRNNDPTAHAEVVAIREACRVLAGHQLDGCDVYCSCEPCPMCLAAVYWAHIEKVFYGGTRLEAAQIAFDDDLIYRELSLPIAQRRIKLKQLLHKEALAAFHEWQQITDKVQY